jgi:enoyl-[acyl-carrier protein] reductase I
MGLMGAIIYHYEWNAPLRDRLPAVAVGSAAAFLCSPLASGITGAVVHVDKGYHAMAVPADLTQRSEG